MKKQQPIAKILLVGGIIAFGTFLLVPTSIPVHGLHKETALLKKYNTLEDLVDDIKNGKVDFKDFRDSDGIALAVMKDSEIYDQADTNTQDCIDFAGKVGHNLGDSEIVHCFEDANYFKNKYSSNSSVPSTSNASSTTTSTVTDTGADTTGFDNVKKNILIDELVKTGKFTEDEAKEFASKAMQGGPEITSATGGSATANTDTSDETSLTKNEGNIKVDSQSSNSNNPEDYNNLGQLVDDIKNGKVNANKISLKVFQNSGAYAGADRQTQDCIDFAGKIGNNLGDSEIVHCSEDTNYFKNKYSS